MPAGLVQPVVGVTVTVYTPAIDTVMELVVAPVLHNLVPLAEVDKATVPAVQLLATVTAGAAGIAFGAAVPEPGALTQKLGEADVWVTVYTPAVVTVIAVDVWPVLHIKEVPVVVSLVYAH